MKKIIFILVSIFMTGICTAQSTERNFCYDAAGNRIMRTISFPCTSVPAAPRSATSSASDEQEEEQMFTEKIGDIVCKAFPNPTTGELTVTIDNYDDLKEGKLTLYTANGQQLQTYEITGATLTLNISAYAPGIYLLNLQMNDVVKNWKIVKE